MDTKSHVTPFLSAVLLVVAAAIVPCRAQPDTTKKAPAAPVAGLIEQLNSRIYKTREEATLRLKEIDEALPALHAALKSADLETTRRIQTIIAVIEARDTERFIKEATAEINQDGIDLFIDRMVLQKGYATEARWKASIGLVQALAKRATKLGAAPPDILGQDFLKSPVATDLDPNAAPNARALVAGSGKLNAFHRCFVFSSGAFEGINSTDRTILFINGDIKSLNSTTNSIIICNGTIKSFNFTKNCLIFCNGVIESMNCTENNTLFVRGELKSLNYTKNNIIEASRLGEGGFSEGNTYVNIRALKRAGNGDQIKMIDPSALSVFQFYDPARSGLAFKMVDGDARVESAAQGKAFAKAGLMKGDLVLAVDHVKFLAETDFVTLLRRRVVAGQALLKVQRGDRILERTVRFAP